MLCYFITYYIKDWWKKSKLTTNIFCEGWNWQKCAHMHAQAHACRCAHGGTGGTIKNQYSQSWIAHMHGWPLIRMDSPDSSVIYTHSSMSTRMHAHTLTHTYTNEVEICPLGLQHTIPCALICAHTKVMSPTSPLPILLFPHPFCQYRPGHVFQDPIM